MPVHSNPIQTGTWRAGHIDTGMSCYAQRPMWLCVVLLCRLIELRGGVFPAAMTYVYSGCDNSRPL